MANDKNWCMQKIDDLRDQWLGFVEYIMADPRLTREEKRRLATYLAEEEKAWKTSN